MVVQHGTIAIISVERVLVSMEIQMSVGLIEVSLAFVETLDK